MITDIRELDNNSSLTCDVCLIGGGVAGIAIARELAGSRIQVCVLESGGLDVESETQALCAGETSGVPYFNLHETRYRMLGGSTYKWGARGAPMQEIDLQQRAWVPHSGWPIGLDELEPYYRRQEEFIGMNTPFSYDERAWSALNTAPPEIDRSRLRFSAFQFGTKLLLGRHYREELRQSTNVSVYLHANVVNIECNAVANHIDRVKVATLDGKKFRIDSRIFVLAAGGIENARILLLSTSASPTGLCNENDLVGRYFMEHPTVGAGTVLADNKDRVHRIFSPGHLSRRLIEIGLAPTIEVQESTGTLNAVGSVKPRIDGDATQALREISWELKHRRLPDHLATRLWQVARDPLGILSNIYRFVRDEPLKYRIDSLWLEIRSEQEPNPNSRVTLSDEKDDLGMARARVHWELTDLDKRTIRTTAECIGNELRRLGVGVLDMPEWLVAADDSWGDDLVGGHHHMGTTRMSRSPEDGVVNPDCRAHAIDNLYIAGSSVFPTAGFVNPTPTIVALAFRLGQHLKAILR